MVLFVATIVSAYCGYVDPRDNEIMPIVALSFPYMILLTVVVGVVWLILGKWIYSLLSLIVILSCTPQLSVSFPMNFGKESIEKPSSRIIKVLTYNIFYGRDIEKPEIGYSRSVNEVLKSDADIVCFQEFYKLRKTGRSRINQEQIDSLKEKYPYIVEAKGIDVMALSKYPMEHIPDSICKDRKKRRHESYRINIGDEVITLINVHLTSFNLQNEQLDLVENIIENNVDTLSREVTDSVYVKLTKAFKQRAEVAEILRCHMDTIEGNVIVCGDFNDVDNSWVYRKVKGDDFKDVHSKVGFGPLITYNYNYMLFGIDHILYKGGLRPLSIERNSLRSSDHYSVAATFELQ